MVPGKRPRPCHYLTQQLLVGQPPTEGLRRSLEQRHEKSNVLYVGLIEDRSGVCLPWDGPGRPFSEIPSIQTLLNVSYVLQAWTLASDAHVAYMYCENGQTKSLLAASAYLYSIQIVQSAEDGLIYGLTALEQEINVLPPSIPRLLRHVTRVLDEEPSIGRYSLKAMALQGIPVANAPILEIYTNTGLIYTSNNTNTLWSDEEGLYSVEQEIEADFCVLCRLGGTKNAPILFRVVHSTVGLYRGTLELTLDQVDVQAEYLPHLDVDDFLLTLVLTEATIPSTQSDDTTVYYSERRQAQEHGWHLITERHTVQPEEALVNSLVNSSQVPAHVARLALQLSNSSVSTARSLLNTIFAEWAVDEDVNKDEECSEADPEVARRALNELDTVLDSLEYLDELSESDLQGMTKDDIRAHFTEDDNITTRLNLPASVFASLDIHPDDFLTALGKRNLMDVLRDSKHLMPLWPLLDNFDRYNVPTPSQDPSNEAAVRLITRHAALELEDLVALRDESFTHQQTEPDPIDPSIPLKNDPRFEKFHRMKVRANLPDEIIRHGLKKDGWDAAIWDDFNWDENYEGQLERKENTPPPTIESKKSLPIKSDPRFEKYFKMKSVGLPDGAIRNAIQRDGADETILDLDWDKNYEEQTGGTSKSDGADADGKESVNASSGGPPMKTDSRFEKYFKMKSVGLPDGAIRNAIQRDGADETILDLDWDKNYEEQTGGTSKSDGADADGKESVNASSGGPPMKTDSRFEKYFKMKSVGLPDGAIQNALARDGVDGKLLELDWEKNYEDQLAMDAGKQEEQSGPPMKVDPRFEKYWKMKGVGLPEGAIRNALMRDGFDDGVFELNWDKNYEAQLSSPVVEEDGPPMKDDPRFQKYFKMQAVGLPDGAIRNAMFRDGVKDSALDLDWERNYEAQLAKPKAKEPVDKGIPLKDDPIYSKYFKMINMGLPMGAIKNALVRDGHDPNVMDFDPNKSVAFQLKAKGLAGSKPPPKKKKVRRKKIYWNAIDKSRIKENSLWSLVRDRVSMQHLNYDVKEFQDLFTESADPADRKKKKQSSDSVKVKKSVQVIDGKRSMNGGIILLRLKIEYSKIAKMVDTMEHGKLDSTQISALKDFLPNQDERNGLMAYMKKYERSEETKRVAYSDLSECEKYMVTVMDIKDASAKFDCMLFRSQFKVRYDELVESIRIVKQACDEVRSSERLREIIALILTLVNEINTGGDGNGAAGFSLDALLKLDEAKAFDKKTSVLQYLAKLVTENDESLLGFRNDLVHVKDAEGIVLDSINAEMKSLQDELELVHKTATDDAERHGEEGHHKLSVHDYKEQRSAVRSIEDVPHYNKVNHLTGRTSMERFTLSAASMVKEASELMVAAKDEYSNLLSFFGEDENMASNDFFGIMRRFMAAFDNAAEQAKKEAKAKEKERLKQEAKDAALNKKKKPAAGERRPPARHDSAGPPLVAVAAMAAAAAAKASKLSSPDRSMNPKPKVQPSLTRTDANLTFPDLSDEKEKDVESTNVTAKPPAPVGLGGIAAAAAAAAAARSTEQKQPKQPEPESRPPPPTMGGIAAAAAAAAEAKRMSKEKDVESTDVTAKPPAPVGLGGIAAAAAAAAAARSTEQKQPKQPEPESRPPPPTMGGIAAAAAAAAEAKRMSKEKDVESTDVTAKPPAPVGLGGIAAAAAAAAAARSTEQKQPKQPEPESRPPPPTMGGIAAAAAAAAEAKRMSKEKDVESTDVTAKPPAPVGLGGIAAAAAAAAAARSTEQKQPKQPEPESRPPPPTMGGIAAAAAAAAEAKRMSKEKDVESTDVTAKPPAPVGLGGIAAAAAAAAAARSTEQKQTRESETEDGKVPASERVPASLSSGSSEMDVTTISSTSERNEAIVEEQPEKPSVSELSQQEKWILAVQAAIVRPVLKIEKSQKKKKKKKKEDEPS